MRPFLTKKTYLNKIPTLPGLYFFKDAKERILYIGKAANLRARVRSYFYGPQPQKVNLLLRESRVIKIAPLASEVEALVKEAAFIKKHKPKYNVLLRDDKNYFYVGITNEEFPKIFVTHQPHKIRNSKWTLRGVAKGDSEIRNPSTSSRSRAKSRDKFFARGESAFGGKTQNSKQISNFLLRASNLTSFVGPFVSGRALKTTLRLLRKIFPYCTCAKTHYRVCLSSQLNLCPGYCCQKHPLSDAANLPLGARREYARRIAAIKKILSGRGSELQKQLESNLETAASEKRFEEAARIRDQLRGLKRVFEHRGLFLETEPGALKTDPGLSALQGLTRILELAELPRRIEFYDASILSGTGAVGGMTAWQNGKPDKSSWRLFQMRKTGDLGAGDPAQITEMLERRLSRREWKLPDLILVDGGSTQYSAAKAAIQRANLKIASAAIVKGKPRNDRLLRDGKTIPFSKLPRDVARLLEQIRDATHRFALGYQRKQRKSRLTVEGEKG
jgi:excinuclease ABC subunit C